ncbi:aldehyde dehydrogenase [Croceicoccus sp. YJ47]|uniref:aldehyde dehydrogenase family protein n=1 Tax=Croceicoccus sp. YJ47 TaxID=2798724 RepID=UPI001F481A94|nr:aldehyde dehydrogenase family protein [Croceicoccus sp. YJ47]
MAGWRTPFPPITINSKATCWPTPSRLPERHERFHSMFFDPRSVRPSPGLFIGGRRVVGAETRQVASPSDFSIRLDAGWASQGQVDEAVMSARHAWKDSGWGTMAPRDRANILYRFADLVDAHSAEIAALEAIASARIYSEAMARDVKVVSGTLRFFGEYADKVEGQVTATSRSSLSMVVHEPYGVVAAIAPWNFPLILAAWKFAPALAAGNAVVLKPSELTPFATLRLAELAVEAGVPQGIFNVINGDGNAGSALVKHSEVDYVTFTGSSATGSRIMADAAMSGLKPVSLELGGKGPQVVFADAPDIERLAQTVARGITYNSGQVCFAGSRLVVERSVADRFIDLVADAMTGLKPGETWSKETSIPPIINEKQIERIDSIVRDSVSDGAEILIGGSRIDHDTALFFQPTVLRGVTTENRAYREEIFGPVLAVQEFEDFDEAIALANHPDYGLTASVHTADITRAFKAAQRIESGTVWLNDWGRRTDLTAPFGGYKKSGIGKDMGRAGYEKYLKSKAIWLELGE